MQRNYVSWHWRVMQNLNKNWCLVSKPTRTSWILTLALESQTNLHFDWCLLCKNINFDLKKYRGIVFHDTEEWYKIWRKTDLWFGKWHEEYGKFSPEQFKVSKLGYWCDSLIQSRKSMSEVPQRSYVLWQWRMMQNLKRNLLFESFRNWHEEFDEFWPEHLKVSKIFILMCSFWAKYILFELKKHRGVIFHETEKGCKI